MCRLLNICWQNATELRPNTVLVDLDYVICQKLLTKCHYDSYDWRGDIVWKGPGTVFGKISLLYVDKGWGNATLAQFIALAYNVRMFQWIAFKMFSSQTLHG